MLATLYYLRNTATGNLHRRNDNPPHNTVVVSTNKDEIEQLQRTLIGGPFEVEEVQV